MPLSLPFPTTTVPVEHADFGSIELTLRTATLDDVDTWERSWKQSLLDHQRDDGDWPWHEHISRALSEENFLCLVLEYQNELQAMISMQWEHGTSRLQSGADILYVEYVGVAPWHQGPPVGQRKIKGLGLFLIQTTAMIAFDLGLDGRVGLHAKPDVEAFYQKIGLLPVQPESFPDGTWLYFEAGPSESKKLLGRR